MATSETADATMSQPTPESAKAKRKHTGDDVSTNGNVPAPTSEQQKDILDVLRRYDVTPSFLDNKFTDSTPVEPVSKRAKLSNNNTQTAISIKLERAQYHTLQDISKDAEQVCNAIIDSVRTKSQDGEQEDNRPSIDDLKQIQRAKAMKQTIEDLVASEISHTGQDGVHVKEELEDDTAIVKKEQQDVGTVLTLFGNAPTPKQLFSSLQHTPTGPATKAALLIEEMSLPNGVSATKIKPSATPSNEKKFTFADAFAPPQSLPQLSAPKAYKRPSTRDNTVTWEFKDTTRGSKRGGYTTQSLTVADWLSYGSNDAPSPREKRKQRERALSGGSIEAQASPVSADAAAELERQEEALFRQAYSSYAPAYDNSRSVVDASLKDLVWWHKVGNKRFDARFSLDPALQELDAMAHKTLPAATSQAFDDSGFAKAVEEYVDDGAIEDEEPSRDMTNADEVLKKISDLLQTLASHQYIRNATVPTSALAAKAPISPAPTTSTKSGKPDVPSEEETSTYLDLQREIAYLVLQLPPYAVAKLNGDQLAELGVSKVITYESANYRGQMEEDQAARLAKYTAAATAAGLASLQRSTSNASPHYSSTSRTPAIGQSANTRYGQSGTYSGRNSMSGAISQRPLTSQSSYGTPTAPPRSQYAQPSQNTRPGATPSYGQTNSQQYQQRQGLNYGSYGQNAAQSQQSRQPLPQFQPRSQMAAANAVSYQTSGYGQNGSPAKSVAMPAGSQSGRATPVNYASPAHTPVNGMPRAPPPLVPRASSNTPQPQNGGPTATPGAVNGHS